jgi:hypothetical protein
MTTTGPITIVIKDRGHPGLIAGLFACFFGFVGIFIFALIFVPLALLCALAGLVRGIVGKSIVGIGTSLLGLVITAFAAVTSPTILLILGISALASHKPAPSASITVQAQSPAAVQMKEPPGQAALQANLTDINLSGTLAVLDKFDSGVSKTLAVLDGTEDKYRAQPAQIDQLHDQVQAAQSAFESMMAQRRDQIQPILDACKVTPAATQSVCANLLAKRDDVNAHIKVLLQRFASLEQFYQQLKAS